MSINIGAVSQSQVATSFTFNITYKQIGSSGTGTLLYQSGVYSQSYSGTLNLTGSSYITFDPNVSYEFTLQVGDYFSTISESLNKLSRTNFTICGDGTLKVGTVYQNSTNTNVLAYLDNQNNDGVFDVQCKQLTTTTGSNVIFKGDGSIICDNVVESGH